MLHIFDNIWILHSK